MCCPVCFFLGAFNAFALLGALLVLLVALAFGPAPLDLPDEVADLCEAVAWFRDTELSYTVASTDNLDLWVKGCRAAFLEMEPEAQELLRGIQKSGRHRTNEMLQEPGIEERTRGWKNSTLYAVDAGLLEEAPPPPFVEISEIRKAFEEARVVRFDATKLLPKHMYLDFLKEKRRQMAGLVVGALSFGVLAPLAVASFRGEPQESLAAVQIMAQLFAVTVVGLAAYGAVEAELGSTLLEHPIPARQRDVKAGLPAETAVEVPARPLKPIRNEIPGMLECLKGARADVQDIKVALEAAEEPKKAFFESAVLFAGTSGASTHQVTSWATMFSMLLLEEFPAMTYSQ
eukprot:g31975.t1